MKYKALILDLDGTAVPSRQDGMPTSGVVDSVDNAKNRLKVCVATGRSLRYCKDVLNALNITEPCVINGGAEIYDPMTETFIFRQYMSATLQKQVLPIIKKFKVTLRSAADGFISPIVDVNQIESDAARLFVGQIPTDEAVQIVRALEKVKGLAAHLTTSWSKGDVVDIHICDARATKKHGIEELLKIVGVNKPETIGIGDYYNDLPLLESVGLKVVMGNAPDEIKKIADYVTDDLEHDGVATAIEKFVLS